MSEAPSIPILLPQAGNTMEEGTILAWRVRVGDRVRRGDVLFELETDKATIEVEAEAEGILAEIVVPDGGTAPVKTPVAYLGSKGPTAPASPTPVTASLPAAPPAPASPVPQTSARTKASPAARRAAEVLGVDLAAAGPGSGPDGRLLREDVERAAKTQSDVTSRFVVRGYDAVERAAKPQPVVSRPAAPTALGGVRKPMTKMRRAIARNLALSKQTLPHWYTKVTIDAQPLLDHAKREKALYPCSVNDVVVLAVSRVVMELPAFRSQIHGDDLVEFPGAHIGIAVGLEQGLVVPVVRSADSLSLKGIAQETRRIIEAAKDGKLEGVGEAVFSISNLGMFGVEEFVAIINPPESGILSVGAIREAVVVRDGAIRAGKVMTMVLSADHRIIDGTMAAKFVGRLKELLENPSLI